MSKRNIFEVITGRVFQFASASFDESISESVADNPQWDDLRFPLTGRNLDTASGRIDFSYPNQTIAFQPNARYPNEPVTVPVQMPHKWKEGTELRPHIHWKQQSTDMPNWILGYKIQQNGQPSSIVADFASYTFATPVNHVFPYTSGTLNQISGFPPIDMTGQAISCMVDVVLFRDSGNVLGLYPDTDPSGLVEHIRDFDMHWLGDSSNGSDQEFTK